MNTSLESHLDLLCDFCMYLEMNCGKEIMKQELHISDEDIENLMDCVEYFWPDEISKWIPLVDLVQYDHLPISIKDMLSFYGKKDLSDKMFLVRRGDGSSFEFEEYSVPFKECNDTFINEHKILVQLMREDARKMELKLRDSNIELEN